MNAPLLSVINPKPNFSRMISENNISASANATKIELTELESEIELWLFAVRSFLSTHNQPFAEGNQTVSLEHNWADELRILRWGLLHSISLLLKAANDSSSSFLTDDFASDENDFVTLKDAFNPIFLNSLADILSDVATISDALLQTPFVNFPTWSAFNKSIRRELERHAVIRALSSSRQPVSLPSLPPVLTRIINLPSVPEIIATDLNFIFSRFLHTLERLKVVKSLLQKDQPLKPALLIFSLVYEETRLVNDTINNRTLRFLSRQEPLYDVLDGTTYALSMEVKRIFHNELVGVSSTRTATAVYAKMETAHGLLFDSFQQSIVAVAQVFEAGFDGSILFPNFKTKLEQSIKLRSDLWEVLQRIRKTEKDPETNNIGVTIEHLQVFRENGMGFLMYKDLDTTERFIEEIFRFRETSEIATVLHRFGAYIETLLGQVNMRTVLSAHPFEYSQNTE